MLSILLFLHIVLGAIKCQDLNIKCYLTSDCTGTPVEKYSVKSTECKTVSLFSKKFICSRDGTITYRSFSDQHCLTQNDIVQGEECISAADGSCHISGCKDETLNDIMIPVYIVVGLSAICVICAPIIIFCLCAIVIISLITFVICFIKLTKMGSEQSNRVGRPISSMSAGGSDSLRGSNRGRNGESYDSGMEDGGHDPIESESIPIVDYSVL